MNSFYNCTIFLVEDDPFCKEVYYNHLSGLGFRNIRGFSSGKELLENLQEKPDLIFLDYFLDDCKGIDLLQKIKESNPNAYIIMLSGQSDMEVTVKLLNNGAFDYIIKGNSEIQKIDEVIAKWVSIYEFNESVKNTPGLTVKKSCLKAIVFAQEKVRKEISNELHDNVSQLLGASKLYLETASRDEQNRVNLISESKTLINDAIIQIRDISHSLQSVYFKKVNLEEEVNKLVAFLKNQNKFVITEELDFEGLSDSVSTNLQLGVVRILQEQINNIVKYSNASKVFISVKNNQKEIQITVKDNGVGFDLEEAKNGIGLTNILDRIANFKGKYFLNTALGKGCTWNIQIPFGDSLRTIHKAI